MGLLAEKTSALIDAIKSSRKISAIVDILLKSKSQFPTKFPINRRDVKRLAILWKLNFKPRGNNFATADKNKKCSCKILQFTTNNPSNTLRKLGSFDMPQVVCSRWLVWWLFVPGTPSLPHVFMLKLFSGFSMMWNVKY